MKELNQVLRIMTQTLLMVDVKSLTQLWRNKTGIFRTELLLRLMVRVVLKRRRSAWCNLSISTLTLKSNWLLTWNKSTKENVRGSCSTNLTTNISMPLCKKKWTKEVLCKCNSLNLLMIPSLETTSKEFMHLPTKRLWIVRLIRLFSRQVSFHSTCMNTRTPPNKKWRITTIYSFVVRSNLNVRDKKSARRMCSSSQKSRKWIAPLIVIHQPPLQ
jgi:hypothetical protein